MSSSMSSSLARYKPVVVSVFGLAVCCSIYYAVTYDQRPVVPLHRSNAVHRPRRAARNTATAEAPSSAPSDEQQPAEESRSTAQVGPEEGQEAENHTDVNDDESVTHESIATSPEPQQQDGRHLKELLYYIAEEQSHQNAYIHRGVTCNSCLMRPIRGIRWRCVNCIDYDLCSECEASSIHDKTHIFYKVKIPAPFLFNPRHEAVQYPGCPEKMSSSLPKSLSKKFLEHTKFEKDEIDALYEQFSCLANVGWDDDPNHIGFAINRDAFDTAFIPLNSIHPPQPNILYDRLFSFYDSNGDGFIGFEELVYGLAHVQNKARDEEAKRRLVFNGFDIDNDGYISRADILRIFRAYYTIQRDIIHDFIGVQEDEFDFRHVKDILHSSQPISAIFTEPPPRSQTTFPVHQKQPNGLGDLRSDASTIVQSSNDTASREEIIKQASISLPDPEDSPLFIADDFSDLLDNMHWEEESINTSSAIANKHAVIQSHALKDRFRRRQFYIDEEEGSQLPDSQTSNVGADSSTTPLGLPRSAPAWKIGELSDNLLKSKTLKESQESQLSRDGTSSYVIPLPRRHVGREILYQLVQQGLNELLDPLFREKEDLWLEIERTADKRRRWHKEVREYEEISNKSAQSPDERSLDDDKTTSSSFSEGTSNTNDSTTDSTEAKSLHDSVVSALESMGIKEDKLLGHDVTAGSTATDRHINQEPVIIRDYTMPQFRPNSEADIPKPQHRSDITALIDASNGLMQRISGVENGSAVETHISTSRDTKSQQHSPSQVELARYAMLNHAEIDVRRAGGPGKLSFDEFEAKMSGERGHRLAFINSWFELGSF